MAFYFAHKPFVTTVLMLFAVMAMADLICCVLAAAPQSSSGRNLTGAAIPRTVDWRKKAAVTDVKQQGECESSWAFSAVAAIEGIDQIKTGKLVSLSAQHLLDCTSVPMPGSCDGGHVAYAFDYIIHDNHGGIASEAAYPYIGRKGRHCKYPSPPPAAMIRSYQVVPTGDEALLAAVAKQPVVVAIAARSMSFEKYCGDVMKASSCGTATDSWMTVVGYGTENGTNYWLVKSSWGKAWGEGGYGKIEIRE